MTALQTIPERRISRGLVAAMVVVCLLVCGIVLSVFYGWPQSAFPFQDEDMAGFVERDGLSVRAGTLGESAFVGDTVHYRVQMRFSPESTTPDLDLLERSISFQPFEIVDHRSSQADHGETSEFTLDYTLVGVDVRPGTSYPLEPIRVHLTGGADGAADDEAIRFSRQPIHVGQYYPENVAGVPLRPLIGEIDSHRILRSYLLNAAGAVILLMVLLILWLNGRRRKSSELSEPERLWRDFDRVNRSQLGERGFLLACERVFVRFLQLRTGLTPAEFWAGEMSKLPESMRGTAREARDLLTESYRREGDPDRASRRMEEIVANELRPFVDEAQLQRETYPGLRQRLLRQPGILAVAGAGVVIALVMISFAALPDVWVSPEFTGYNTAVIEAQEAGPIEADPEEFETLSESSPVDAIRAASFYNAATIRAHLAPTSTGFGEAELLNAVFQTEEPVISFLDDQESIELLLDAGILLKKAENELKQAARLAPFNDDVSRNLEIVGKRARAVSRAVQDMFDQGSSMPQARGEAMADVLNMEMPEEYTQEDSGKDDSNYLTLEEF